jgi:SNF2 family DNA or RNA helicase
MEDGVQNLDQLQQITSTWAYVLRKHEIAADLPPNTFVPRYIAMTTEQERAYEQMLEENKATINETTFSFQRQDTPFAKLHQIANGYIKRGDTVEFFKKQPKLEELLHVIEEAGDEKHVVWSPFVDQIKQIEAFLNKHDISCVTLYGATAKNKRRDAVHAFHGNKQVLIANPDVAGLGLNLTCAYIQHFMTNWFKADVRLQAVDRLHRQGQLSAVLTNDYISIGTVEKRILRSLMENINLENQILTPNDLRGVA